MATIRLLSEGLINRIAAGEVVERPAAVLKELIENSLDAGATRLEIEAEAGGRRLIQVSDNGQGMNPDDMLLAIERHATSKISEDTDLVRIDTLGFRGEALPSIGAVSRMKILSSDRTDGQGQRLALAGGRLMDVRDAARDQGTTIEVRDLFFNVPARRKFLKSVQTEAAHLLETIYRWALSRLDLRLVYKHNGQTLLTSSPREDARTRLALVLGRETARTAFPFEGEAGGIETSGFLCPPGEDRSRSSGLYLFVNGRPVADRLLTRAVLEAYRGRLASGRYPVAVVRVNLPPELVDVNVHPAKTEVRFQNPREVFAMVSEVVGQALAASLRPLRPHPPASTYPAYNPAEPPAPAFNEAFSWPEYPSSPPRAFPPGGLPDPRVPDSLADRAPDPFAGPVMDKELHPVGQLYQSYILAQGPDGLHVVDQHAAHERVIFERLQAQLAEGELDSQVLLLPATLELTPVQARRLEEYLTELQRYGFDLEPFGGRTFVLRAVPAILAGRDAAGTLQDIIEDLPDDRQSPLADFEETLLAPLACHSAIKAGEAMTRDEMDRLLRDLGRTRVQTNCPHGRPLVFSLSRRDIEKRFKRI